MYLCFYYKAFFSHQRANNDLIDITTVYCIYLSLPPNSIKDLFGWVELPKKLLAVDSGKTVVGFGLWESWEPLGWTDVAYEKLLLGLSLTSRSHMSSTTLSTQLSSSLIDERTLLVSMVFFLLMVHRSIGAEDNDVLEAAPTAVVVTEPPSLYKVKYDCSR